MPGNEKPTAPDLTREGEKHPTTYVFPEGFEGERTALAVGMIDQAPDQPRLAEPAPPPPHKLQAKFLKQARKAARAGDSAGVKSNVLEWGRIQWPDESPRSVGEIARRVSMPLSVELENMCQASYGPEGRDWDGEALAKALRSFSVLEAEDGLGNGDGLPPLFPGTA